MNTFTHFAWGAFLLLLIASPRRHRVLWLVVGGILGISPDIDLSFAINGLAEHGCSIVQCSSIVGNLSSPTHNIYFTLLMTVLAAALVFDRKNISLTARIAIATFIIVWMHWAILDYRTPLIRGFILPFFNGYADGCNRLVSTIVGLIAWGGIVLLEILKERDAE